MKKHAKRLFKIITPVSILLCSSFFIPWQTLSLWIKPLPDTIQDQVNQATTLGFDGIIVYVNQAGKAPEFYAAGWRDRDKKINMDPHALFKIASISKLYIAVAVSKLVNDNQVSLDDTLARLLPELTGRIENAENITIRMLLQHRSGIPDWIKDKEFPWNSPPKDSDSILALILDDPERFQPDARYEYSNTNYLLLGKILDNILGYGHHQYIRKEILTPLGLRNTFGTLADVDSTLVVSGYDIHFSGDVKMLDFVAASGAMVATAEDVGIFLRALNDGSLLSENEQKIYSSVYTYEHTGLLPGYQSIARYHKDIDTVVIQFVNTSGGQMWSKSEVVYNRIVKIIRKRNK